MTLRAKLLIALAILAVLDVLIPFPLLVAFLIYVTAARPLFFREWVQGVYETSRAE